LIVATVAKVKFEKQTKAVPSVSARASNMAKKTGEAGLLMWAQMYSTGYKGVAVKDFTKSWADGLAFCALLVRLLLLLI